MQQETRGQEQTSQLMSTLTLLTDLTLHQGMVSSACFSMDISEKSDKISQIWYYSLPGNMAYLLLASGYTLTSGSNEVNACKNLTLFPLKHDYWRKCTFVK